MIDVEGIKSLLKPECEDCNVIFQSLICGKKNCPFNMDGETDNTVRIEGEIGVTCGIEFDKYGVYRMKKHHVYYFLAHPELEFQLPTPLPPNSYWIIHHLDLCNSNDDHLNLELISHKEHINIHQ